MNNFRCSTYASSAYGDLNTFLNAQLVDCDLVRLGLCSIVFVYKIISVDTRISGSRITIYMTAHKNITYLLGFNLFDLNVLRMYLNVLFLFSSDF